MATRGDEEQLRQMGRQLRVLRLTKLLRLKQGNKTITEFLRQAEEQAKLCCNKEQPITVDELVMITLGRGMNDRNLARRLLQGNSAADVEARQGKAAGGKSPYREIKEKEEQLAVRKLSHHSKYSVRFKPEEETARHRAATKESQGRRKEGADKEKCNSCDLTHLDKICWAAGQVCYRCGGVGHYARSAGCRAKEARVGGRQRVPGYSCNRVKGEGSDKRGRPGAKTSSWRSTMQDPAMRVWPGVQAGSKGAVRRVAVQEQEYSEREQERHSDQRKHGAAETAGDWAAHHGRQRQRSDQRKSGAAVQASSRRATMQELGETVRTPRVKVEKEAEEGPGAAAALRGVKPARPTVRGEQEGGDNGVARRATDREYSEELERQGRALATTNGYQGTDPGHQEDQTEEEGEMRQRGKEGEKDPEEEVKLREEERKEDPVKWLTQGRRRGSRSRRV
jgi:hypothetical protein